MGSLRTHLQYFGELAKGVGAKGVGGTRAGWGYLWACWGAAWWAVWGLLGWLFGALFGGPSGGGFWGPFGGSFGNHESSVVAAEGRHHR